MSKCIVHNGVYHSYRHHHGHHSKLRKFSLPEDAGQKKTDVPGSKGRRISTQPEDLPLKGADRDQLDSHRSDDPRALRRHKTSRPSVVHISRKEGAQPLTSAYLKKMYDHSPHAVSYTLDKLALLL